MSSRSVKSGSSLNWLTARVGVDLPATKSVASCVLKVKQGVSFQRFQFDSSTGHAVGSYHLMSTRTMIAMETGNSVKRDARHLEELNDVTDYTNNRQVMSPTLERDQAGRPKQQRPITPRTNRALHRGREITDENASIMEGEFKTFSAELTTSFHVRHSAMR
eukprot:471038-Amphidinium_carterae.1